MLTPWCQVLGDDLLIISRQNEIWQLLAYHPHPSSIFWSSSSFFDLLKLILIPTSVARTFRLIDFRFLIDSFRSRLMLIPFDVDSVPIDSDESSSCILIPLRFRWVSTTVDRMSMRDFDNGDALKDGDGVVSPHSLILTLGKSFWFFFQTCTIHRRGETLALFCHVC